MSSIYTNLRTDLELNCKLEPTGIFGDVFRFKIILREKSSYDYLALFCEVFTKDSKEAIGILFEVLKEYNVRYHWMQKVEQSWVIPTKNKSTVTKEVVRFLKKNGNFAKDYYMTNEDFDVYEIHTKIGIPEELINLPF